MHFRKERQAKKEEQERKHTEQTRNEPKIKELTEEEAEKLENELKQKKQVSIIQRSNQGLRLGELGGRGGA